jgi:hypothetical protein
VVIFACGLAWLSALVGLPQAISGGLTPFLLSAAVKIVFATVLVPLAWSCSSKADGRPQRKLTMSESIAVIGLGAMGQARRAGCSIKVSG